jgi:hypothetical protein
MSEILSVFPCYDAKCPFLGPKLLPAFFLKSPQPFEIEAEALKFATEIPT